jgi:hypothetical protein
VNEDDRTWDGVLIYEVVAKFQSTAAKPRSTDPDLEGDRIRQVIEAALKADAAGGQFQVGEVRYAGSRGSTHYD